MTLDLPVTIGTCGAPLTIAVAGTFAYRGAYPLAADAVRPGQPVPMRRLSKQSLPGEADDHE